MIKKIICVILSMVFVFLNCSINASANNDLDTSKLISQWISSAIKYASLGEYENFKSLYGDIDKSIINDEFLYFKDTVYKNKYKCTFNIVSDRSSGQSIVDFMAYKIKSQNGNVNYEWDTTQMCFMKYNDSIIRIPINFFLKADYIKSNKEEYINGFNNNDAWVKHNNGVFKNRALPALRYAKLNDDGSVTIVVSIANTHKYKATVYCLYPYNQEPMLKFGGYDIDVSGLLEVKAIPANSIKNYTIKIPAKLIKHKLTSADIVNCEFKFAYSYMCNGIFTTGCINSKFQGQITI